MLHCPNSLQKRRLRNAEHLRVTLPRNSFQKSHREFPRTSLGCIQSNAPRQISQAAQCINAYRRAVRLHSRERHMGSRLRGVQERQAWVPGHFPWVPSKAGDQHAPWPAKIRDAARPQPCRVQFSVSRWSHGRHWSHLGVVAADKSDTATPSKKELSKQLENRFRQRFGKNADGIKVIREVGLYWRCRVYRASELAVFLKRLEIRRIVTWLFSFC